MTSFVGSGARLVSYGMPGHRNAHAPGSVDAGVFGFGVGGYYSSEPMLDPTNQDAELLRRYADTHAEEAFTELVSRHLPLVYSAAVRQLKDPDRARDVAQLVFLEVARQASRLRAHPAFGGWLHTTTFRLARRALRDDRRRERREQEAHAMQELNRDTDRAAPDPRRWKDVIDEALQELRDSDRTAVILRHLEGRSLREVGDSLGIGEDAARMRVQRALERLQTVLTRKGCAAAGSTLVADFAALGLETVPAGLAAEVVGGAVSGAAATLAGTAAGTSFVMTMKVPLVATAAAVLVVAVPLVQWNYRVAQVRTQIEQLGPEPRIVAPSPTDEADAAARREAERLRAELPELDRLRAEAAELLARSRQPDQAAVASARKTLRSLEIEASTLREEEELRQSREAAIQLLMNVGVAARVFSTAHGDRLPERFDEMTEALGGSDSPFLGELDRYEFFPHPRRISLEESRYYLVREKQPRRRPDGRWERAYALVDGSVQLLDSPTEDFTQVEIERGGVATVSAIPGASEAPIR